MKVIIENGRMTIEEATPEEIGIVAKQYQGEGMLPNPKFGIEPLRSTKITSQSTNQLLIKLVDYFVQNPGQLMIGAKYKGIFPKGKIFYSTRHQTGNPTYLAVERPLVEELSASLGITKKKLKKELSKPKMVFLWAAAYAKERGSPQKSWYKIPAEGVPDIQSLLR